MYTLNPPSPHRSPHRSPPLSPLSPSPPPPPTPQPQVAGIVDGVCFDRAAGDKHCTTAGRAALLKTVQHVNMLPELIQMQV